MSIHTHHTHQPTHPQPAHTHTPSHAQELCMPHDTRAPSPTGMAAAHWHDQSPPFCKGFSPLSISQWEGMPFGMELL